MTLKIIQKELRVVSQTRFKGTVKHWDESKGYGFIAADGDAGETFCLSYDIITDGFRMLVPGQRVEFEYGKIKQGRAGFIAKKIVVLLPEGL